MDTTGYEAIAQAALKQTRIALRAVRKIAGMSRDTQAYTANVFFDDRKIGYITDDGQGGPAYFTQTDPRDYPAAEVWVRDNMPARKVGEYACRVVDVAEALACYHMTVAEERAWYKRACRKQTLYRLTGDADKNWRTIKAPYSADVRNYLRTKYGAHLVEIANETRI